jgi:hypothetical protein
MVDTLAVQALSVPADLVVVDGLREVGGDRIESLPRPLRNVEIIGLR